MKQLLITLFLLLEMTGIATAAEAEQPDSATKVMVLDFQLNDLTDLPNAPEELERIALLSATYKQKLDGLGVNVVPINDKLKPYVSGQSPTYLFDNVEHAAKLTGHDADYLLIGVALKPTYLFVYPRILLVDVKSQKVVMAKAAQLESSWSDKNTTVRTGEKLAQIVSDALKNLVKQNTQNTNVQ